MYLGGNQEFASPEEALAHFGVKGMKWGVRKEDAPAADVAAKASIVGAGMGYGVRQFELHDPGSLKTTTTKGYADVRPVGGFANASVASRHAELISTLDEMRASYPAVKDLKIEVVPMSRVPGQESSVADSFAAVQAIKHGEARIMYNDQLGELQPFQTEYLKTWMPGVGTKNYVGYHEMGHLLAVAHGTQPPTYDAVMTMRSRKDANRYYKTNQKNHEALLKRHGLSYKQLRSLSNYAGTMPSEALAELSGYYHSPVMRQRLTAETQRKAKSLFDEMGGLS